MKRLFLLASASVFLLTSCQNAAEHSNDNHTTETAVKTETNTVENADSHVGHGMQVQLDNGKKWKANPETVEGIARMEAIITKSKSDNTAPGTLYEPLSTEFKTIFDKCTMTGEAHNQLHNYLVPIKDNLDKLKVEATASEGVSNIEGHLKMFGNYFEL